MKVATLVLSLPSMPSMQARTCVSISYITSKSYIYLYIAFLLLILSPSPGTLACNLHGTDSGECTMEGKDPAWRLANMPFCADSVGYPVCVPKAQSMPPSREFPIGRWDNHTIYKKDDWVKANYYAHVRYREGIEKEYNYPEKATMNENGTEPTYFPYVAVAVRFHQSPDCQEAYRNYFCWINFPRCDAKRDLTFPTCRSACENFFISCGYIKDLHRCGKSKWYNGYFPEPPPYKRDYFPGQPFRQNKFSLAGNDMVVCTPSIQGSASRVRIGVDIWSLSNMLMLIVSIVISLFFIY